MAFSDYKSISQVQKEFGIRYEEENFIQAGKIEPSVTFMTDLKFNLENIDVFTSEASRTELVISPILREIYKNYHEQYSFWIQKAISYNESLSGVPDYLIATKSALGKTVLETPLVVVVEAKKNDFEQGWGQCLVELVTAQKINGDTDFAVHGIVTDGESWKFGKLKKATFVKNIEGFSVNDLPELFGAIDFVLRTVGTN